MKKPVIRTIDPRGRVVLPASLRKAAGLQAGDPIAFRTTQDGLLLCPVGKGSERKESP